MKKVLLSVLTVSLLAVSCQKDDPDGPVVPPEPVQFMSLTAGSTWNYERVDKTAPATTTPYTLTSTSRDSAINSRSYHVFTTTDGGNEYYNISGNDYFTFQSLPSALGGSNVEYTYLKDNVAAGASWSQTFPASASGIPFNAVLTNTVTEKGISKTVKGKAYTNVIHITTTISITIGGVPLPGSALTTDIQSFYAEKIGLIQSVSKIDLDFSGITDHSDQEINLVSADIK